VLLHPSLLIKFPSSQASASMTIPSPHLGMHCELAPRENPEVQAVQTLKLHAMQFRKVAQSMSQTTTPEEEL
jgi:hypothetical protein